MPSTKELVNAARAGEKAAFGQLCRLYERAGIIAAYAVLHGYHSAQDVSQDAFLNAYMNLHQLRDASAFGPWVLQIVRRKALLAQSAIRSDPIVADVVTSVASQSNDWIEKYKEVIDQLARLPEHERTVVVLRYVEGHSVQEIANTTGKLTDTIRKQPCRAVQRLRPCRADSDDGV
jgi:RNA polymerase sigma-70 factor (ECF subfamily)